jgi:diacylglycerol kinase
MQGMNFILDSISYGATGLATYIDQHAAFQQSCHHILDLIHQEALAVLLGHSLMSVASTPVPALVLLGLLVTTVSS